MKWPLRILTFGLSLALVGAIGAAVVIGGAYYYLEPQLPSIENLRDVRLQVPLRVYSADDKLIAEFGEKRRLPVAYAEVPAAMVHAILAAEDDGFFSHPGVDFKGLLRAGVQLILTGERRQGGSTITMQVARNFYLTREKTFTRKLNEIFLALRIEQDLTKEEILELYVNKIYLGHRAYGVGAAARVYYGKTLGELDLAETAMIAGLPKAPSRYNPIADPARAIQRRNYVLGRMLELGYVDAAAHAAATAAPVTASLHAADIETEAPYAAEMVRAQLFEAHGEDAYTNGYVVHTTIDSRHQTAANRALRNALDAYDRRHGYRGPEGRVTLAPDDTDGLDQALRERSRVGELRPAVVTAVDGQAATAYLGDGLSVTLPWDGLEWAQPYVNQDRRGPAPKQAADVLAPGDLIRVREWQPEEGGETAWRLAQIPEISGALVSLRPGDGAILALVGGYDFYSSKFNRATQAKRQPGSGFKAFIYSAALEAGFTPASLINDAPVVIADASLEDDWRPENYSGKFFGPTRLRLALTKSRNLVSIRLLRSMGIAAAVEHISRFGFAPEDLPRNLSLALGSAAVTPLEMARGYAVLANGGYLIEPYLVARITEDDKGEVFVANPPIVCPDCRADQPPAGDTAAADDGPGDAAPALAPRVISPENRFQMYSMMQDVIRAGTATRARSLGRKDLAGKTGTTNDQRDAWFNGYNQALVAVVWVGFDSNAELGRGEVGGKAALPAWIEYMETALQDVPDLPPEMPEGMVTALIDPDTGEIASASEPGAIEEVFRAENIPASGSGATAAPIGGRRGGGSTQAPPVEDLF
ncbi:MAG: penicillin-binding protein 1A [Gammaproteobacteria bacterium]